MQFSRQPIAIGECHANFAIAELVAEQLGALYRIKHCTNIARCMKELKKNVSIKLAVIDYEKDAAVQKQVDRYLRMRECTCTNWNRGVKVCSCILHGAQQFVVLLEGGVEEALGKLGYRLDIKIKACLKSDKVVKDVRNRRGEAYEMLQKLAQHIIQLKNCVE